MNSRQLPRIVAAGLLAVLLGLPASAQAHTPGTRGPADAWTWLASLWQKGISTLWSRDEAAQKIGQGIDPNGGNGPGVVVPGTTPDPGSQSDAGLGIDPNG